MEFQPILSPGLHEIDQSELDNHFASDFPESITRLQLIAGLRSFLSALKHMEIAFEVWIDGSFTTTKQNPNDIDLVVFADSASVNGLPEDKILRLNHLFNNLETRRYFGLDVYFCPAENEKGRTYWHNWYGFDRNKEPKGIAKVIVEP